MILAFGFAIFIIIQLRKVVKTKEYYPEWDRILRGILWINIACVAIGIPLENATDISLKWAGYLMILALGAITYLQPVFRPARYFIHAWWPVIGLLFFNDVIQNTFPTFYEKYEEWLEIANVFAVIWLIYMMVITSRQRKALNKARQVAEEEEREKRMMEILKAELEVQVAERTAELTLQKNELEHALEELKTTQVQLIHSEKMASLGELTAGIAHEIQNPLNFVNNFSDVNRELLEELKVELDKGNYGEVKTIADDILANELKIVHHGKRADAIVKGMLMHSRSSSDEKEEVDINELCDEYLRLSYHGLRAKDKFFNATFHAELDPNAGTINIIPQEIGRVLLNLFNNAFYSVSKKKTEQSEGYEPTVTLTTKRYRDSMEIRIRDNGIGIPDSVMDRMFQPFFTTKPTGQGTGLGLSLSFDIVTKGHGGTLSVKTKEGEFAEFIISLPLD